MQRCNRAPTILSLQQMPAFFYLPAAGYLHVQKADPATSNPEQEQRDAAQYAAWRAEVASRLNDAGRWSESVNFQECGQLWGNFQVLVCSTDATHEARALPFTCHLRYCPECERRHQAEQVAKYTPILKSLADEGSRDRDNWSLKKIVLTTPFPITSPTAKQDYHDAWEYFERWQQLMLQDLLQGEMTAGEKRRGRIELKDHGYGSMVSSEYGEEGKKLHFHITAYCPFMPKFKTSEKWLQASGGNCEVTDIRRIDYHDVENAVREQVKYITKFSKLAPELVIKLADILDGAHRVRTYGVVRGKVAVREACTCSACQAKLTIIRVQEYFYIHAERNTEPDPVILAAAEKIGLEFKRGNKAGESGVNLARSDIPDLPIEQLLPYFEDIAPKKPDFRYF